MTDAQPFATLGYVPVGHIRHKLIGRWLRAQRKSMLRFFEERGFFDLALRVRKLRDNPKLDRMTKNRQFQRILDDYAKLVTPAAGETPQPVAEASGSQDRQGSEDLGVPPASSD